MCFAIELDWEVVLTFTGKRRGFPLWAKHPLESDGDNVEAESTRPPLPNVAFARHLTLKCCRLSRQYFTHFALTSSHLYARSKEFLATWRGKQSMEWRGGGRRAFVLLLPLLSPVPCVRPLCPFARSLQMAYCAAIGGSLSSQSSLLCVAPGRGQSGAGRRTPTAAAATTTTPSSGEPGGIYAIDPVAPSSAQSKQAGWPWLARLARVADATAITEALPTPLQKMAIRAESIRRPPRKRVRDPSHISLPVDTGIANLYL